MRNLLYPFLFLSMLALSGCDENEPFPTAAFTYSGNNSFTEPCSLIFVNKSVNTFSWEWDFGDDSVSTVKDPVHVYPEAGEYTVRLKAFTESRKEWAVAEKSIIIKPDSTQVP
ncbi:MAG: PKD domain-containing protein [Bacteroidetes bacterium]|nr:PKD domain-containing protein [Bacteroidota bacterium]